MAARRGEASQLWTSFDPKAARRGEPVMDVEARRTTSVPSLLKKRSSRKAPVLSGRKRPRYLPSPTMPSMPSMIDSIDARKLTKKILNKK